MQPQVLQSLYIFFYLISLVVAGRRESWMVIAALREPQGPQWYSLALQRAVAELQRAVAEALEALGPQKFDLWRLFLIL